jgi:hypothetical protein
LAAFLFKLRVGLGTVDSAVKFSVCSIHSQSPLTSAEQFHSDADSWADSSEKGVSANSANKSALARRPMVF